MKLREVQVDNSDMDTTYKIEPVVAKFVICMRLNEADNFIATRPIKLSETELSLQTQLKVEVGQEVQCRVKLCQIDKPMIIDAVVTETSYDDVNDLMFCVCKFVDIDRTYSEEIKLFNVQTAFSLSHFLAEFPLFEDFTQQDCETLAKFVTYRELEKKQVLYYEKTTDSHMQGLFIVQSGLLSIYKGKKHRPDKQIAVVSPGQIFGENTLVTDQPHTATIAAVNESTLIQISKIGFQRLKEKYPELGLKFMEIVARTLSKRLGRTTKLLFNPIELKK